MIERAKLEILSAALVGDALGTPFTGLKHGHVQQLVGATPDGFLQSGILLPDHPARNHVPGLHSSFAQRLVAGLAAGFPDEMGRDPVARVGALMLDLAGGAEGEEAETGAWRVAGRPLAQALARWRREYPWEEKDYRATTQESEGLSAVSAGMAAAILPGDDPAGLAIRLARLTHTRSMPLMAAAAMAELMRLLVEGRPWREADLALAVGDLAGKVRDREKALEAEMLPLWRDIGWGRPPACLSEALDALPSLLREANDDLAIRTIVATAGQCYPRSNVTHVQHGFVAAGFLWAIYRALGAMPAVRALEDVMARGGECSAIASMVAALAVARRGCESIPDEWYAGACAAGPAGRILASAAPDWEAWLAMERGWTQEERSLQAELQKKLDREAEQEKARGRQPARKAEPATPFLPDQEEAPFAPPPHLWLKPGEEEDPRMKKILKAQRGRRKIDWKEERRQKQRGDD